MNDHEALRADIEVFFRQKFTGVDIVSVTIESDTFTDHERVLEIQVKFKGNADQLVRARPRGLLSSLRERIDNLSSNALPVLNFVSMTDAHA